MNDKICYICYSKIDLLLGGKGAWVNTVSQSLVNTVSQSHGDVLWLLSPPECKQSIVGSGDSLASQYRLDTPDSYLAQVELPPRVWQCSVCKYFEINDFLRWLSTYGIYDGSEFFSNPELDYNAKKAIKEKFRSLDDKLVMSVIALSPGRSNIPLSSH